LAKETKIGDKNKYLKKGGHVTIGLMILAKIGNSQLDVIE